MSAYIHPSDYWRLRARIERVEKLANIWLMSTRWGGEPATVDRAFGNLLQEALDGTESDDGMESVTMLWEDAPQDMEELQELQDLQKTWRERRFRSGKK